MKKLIVIAILVGLVYAAHYFNPTFNMHKKKIAPNVPVTSELWSTLSYNDYYLVSFTSTTVRGTMVSMGAVTWVGIMDSEWEPGRP